MSGWQKTRQKLVGATDAVRELQARAGDFDKWNSERVLAYVDALFGRFCPWKVGDLAMLIVDLDIKRESGWYGWRHLLVNGAVGKILETDFYKGKFQCLWVPLGQMRTDWSSMPNTYDPLGKFYGCYREIPDERPGCFTMWEGQVEKVVVEL